MAALYSFLMSPRNVRAINQSLRCEGVSNGWQWGVGWLEFE